MCMFHIYLPNSGHSNVDENIMVLLLLLSNQCLLTEKAFNTSNSINPAEQIKSDCRINKQLTKSITDNLDN